MQFSLFPLKKIIFNNNKQQLSVCCANMIQSVTHSNYVEVL